MSLEKIFFFRLGAAMMELWGKNSAKEWMPDNFETDLKFDADTAARMIVFYASNKMQLKQLKESGIVKYVKILATNDSCDTCKKFADKNYKLKEVPELPHEHCTHKMGCRCTIIANM